MEEAFDLLNIEVGGVCKVLCQILLLLFHPQRNQGKWHVLHAAHEMISGEQEVWVVVDQVMMEEEITMELDIVTYII